MEVEMADTFLNAEEIRQLTGRCHRAPQMAVLKENGIPFFVNATGWPVVARSAIEGKGAPVPVSQKKGWVPKVLTAG
jgi:hypothetical protein